MTILDPTRTGDNAFATLEKGFVVESGAHYRAEQGNDYEPGVSAETVRLEIDLARNDYLAARAARACTSIMKHLYSRKHPARRRESRRAIRSRSGATAQESVVFRPEMDGRVP
jgi:hypothetical protein